MPAPAASDSAAPAENPCVSEPAEQPASGQPAPAKAPRAPRPFVPGNARKPNVTRELIPVPGTSASVPVVTLAGGPGPRFAFTAGVHADEYVHEQALVELSQELAAADIAGTVVIVPVANMPSFERRGTSMLPDDGTNLNRVFPGDPGGNLANRLARVLFDNVICQADYYCDCHSGDYYEDLSPHAYYLDDVEASPLCAQMAAHTSAHTVCPYGGARTGGSQVVAAVAGVPAIILERGGMGRWSRDEVEAAKSDIMNLLRWAGVVEGEARDYGAYQRVFQGDDMVDNFAPVAGCWYPAKRPEEPFAKGEELGQIRDVFGRVLHTVVAPRAGMVIFQTGSLNVVEGGPLISYGLYSE